MIAEVACMSVKGGVVWWACVRGGGNVAVQLYRGRNNLKAVRQGRKSLS